MSSVATTPTDTPSCSTLSISDSPQKNVNGQGVSETVIHSSPAPANNARCDRCRKGISDVRYKCQRCPDFDYCTTCVRYAASIHPGHNFTPLRGFDQLTGDDLVQHDQSAEQERLDPTTFRLVGRDTSMPASLCPSCQPVTMPLPAIGAILQDEEFRRQAKDSLQLRWPARLSQLVEATVGGCAFCSLVLNRFFGPGNAIFFGYEPLTTWVCQVDDRQRKATVDHAMHLLTLLPNDEFVFGVEPIRGPELSETDFSRLRVELVEAKQGKEILRSVLASSGLQYIELDVYAAETNPAAKLISSRPPNASPASPEALAQVKAWLAKCEREHGEACAARSSPLPSRVIDVSSGTNLRLLEISKGSLGRYVALSYCWGEAQQFQTKKATLQDRLLGFTLDDLPQTLQDAVTITKALGIDYLWVDTISIVQDDPLDRASEIKAMAETFKHATLTIAASKADAASKGFLQDGAREETGLWKNLFPLAFPITNPEAKSINEAFGMTRTVFGTLWLCDEDPGMVSTFRSPADRRGWCLQERLLSSRLLSYGRWPTWRCSRGTYSDGGFYPSDQEKDRHERRVTRCLAQQRQHPRILDLPMDLHTSTQLLQSWYKLLNEYTQRELGVKSDRLPAIGGIALEIARATGFPYLAGLWRPNILHDLMWTAKTKEWLTRVEGYTGPTWSWAAVDCPISYDDTTEDSLTLARVLSCDVGPGPSGPFGEITSGRVEIEGPFLARIDRHHLITLLKDQDVADAPPQSNDVQEWYRQILAHINNQPTNNTKEDKWEDSLPLGTGEICVLVTFSREWRVVHERRVEGAFYSGLILKKAGGGGLDGDSVYQRIGAFVNEEREWLDITAQGWGRKKIVLV